MNKRRLVIVGGGSAGWMTAAYLNGALNDKGNDPKVDIHLIESPDTPRISVGEATIPSMRHLLAVIGVDELDFMRVTDATFKQSIKYTNWVHNNNTCYHHPFSRATIQPLDNMGLRWLQSDQSIPFMETCSAQPVICEMGLAPKMFGEWRMGQPLSYAYHMNALKFADYLCDFSVKRGVKHTWANVVDIGLRDKDHIQSVTTDQGHTFEADVFVDCTGFSARLMEATLGVGFEDCSQWLLCDRAITMHVPYDEFYPGMVRPYTTATALSNGWIWDIPMQNRRSIGYVHSSAFIDEESAEREMRAYQGPHTESLSSRLVKFKVGRRHRTWHGNCVAIGLSGGFIEPLESTGLYLSDMGAVMLAEHFPWQDDNMDVLAMRYNRLMSNRFYEILDFINMHYCLTQRTDTAFWREVQKPERINDRLKAKLAYWKIKPPSPSDFDDMWLPGQTSMQFDSHSAGEDNRPPIDTAGLWNYQSYECILYGMGYLQSQSEQWFGQQRPPTKMNPMIMQRLQMARNNLPRHADWLQKVAGMKMYHMANKPVGWVA